MLGYLWILPVPAITLGVALGSAFRVHCGCVVCLLRPPHPHPTGVTPLLLLVDQCLTFSCVCICGYQMPQPPCEGQRRTFGSR